MQQEAGARLRLTATVNGTNKDAVTWSSSNTGVAKVTNGVVQGTGAGKQRSQQVLPEVRQPVV